MAAHAERLRRLREELARQNVTAFILQRTDPHGSEYLPANEERVAWLTGFSGSSATVVVLADRAAILSDGRYTDQLSREVDGELFEAVNVSHRTTRAWLAEHLSPGGGLGYDPFLTKRTERRQLERTCHELDTALVALDVNPVDAIWQDRPARPLGAVVAHEVVYAGKTSVEKRRQIAERLTGTRADYLVVCAADSIAWLLNVRGNDIPFNPLVLSYLILGRDRGCRWFVDLEKLRDPLSLDERVNIEPYEAFLSSLETLGRSGARVLVDPSMVHDGFITCLESTGAKIIERPDPIQLEKARKNEVECEGARAAHRRDGAAFSMFLHWLDSTPQDGSVDELKAAQRLHDERALDAAFRGLSFETIAAHGPNAALPHYRVTRESSRALTRDHVFLCDSGAHYLDGTTDITRTVILGRASDSICRAFTLVLKGHIAIARAVFPPGTTGAQLDSLARQYLWRDGCDFDHGTGHGVGSYLCVHEGPQRLSRRGGDAVLEPGMILSNEPGHYVSGHYGIRLENLLLVSEMPALRGNRRLGFETLTLAPIDRRMIIVELLSHEERRWLDEYHARVFAELGPLLKREIRGWLDTICAPL